MVGATLSWFAYIVATLSCTEALNNGLGLVPPMGWNSWNAFVCDINETKILAATEKLEELGLVELGYNHVNLDDCWMSPNRTQDGKYTADPITFPSGMKSLGDYLHNKSLKFGIYTSAGNKTCQGLPGSLGHEQVDAQTFADWGVDYLKYDNCYNENKPGIDRYSQMRNALNATGRKIFYSLCQWGDEESWQWAPQVGNSWRTTSDIKPHWSSIRGNFWESQQHARRSQPGAWLDPDMLEVGDGNLTDAENQSHFSLWCLIKAPLLLGMDLNSLTEETLAIITNARLIAVNQDPNSPQAICYQGCSVTADWSILATTLTNGDTVTIIINWSDGKLSLESFSGQSVGIVPTPMEYVVVQDLWRDEQVGAFDFEALKHIPLPPLEPHASVVLQMTAYDRDDPLVASEL